MPTIVTHRSTASMWNCDEMGHLNVRYYVAKADSAATHMANILGLGPRLLTDSGWLLRPLDHHVRFLREVHAGAGLYIESSVLSIGETTIRLCHEIRRSIDQGLSATLTGDLELVHKQSGTAVPFPAEFRARAGEFLQPLPDHAAPRGLSLTPAVTLPTLARADELGLPEIFRGGVDPSQCDDSGRMMAAHYLGTISNGVANLFLQDWGKGAADPQNRRIGGAALEYRLLYHRPCAAGNLLVVRSCMVHVGEKSLRHAHWVFDAETGDAVASAQAVAVFIDMVERRAIAVPAAARCYLQSLLKPELAG